MGRKPVENNKAFEIQQGLFWNITSKFLLTVWGEFSVLFFILYIPSILESRMKILRFVALCLIDSYMF